MPVFHTIKSSAELSGINVSLRDGTIYADNMSLNNTQLIFKNEESRIFTNTRKIGPQETENHEGQKRKLQVNSDGIFYTHDYILTDGENNATAQVRNVVDEFGIDFSLMSDINNQSRKNTTYIGMGAMQLEMRGTDDKYHWMTMDPKLLATSTPNFLIRNSDGSTTIEGKGVTINTNASGLSLKGEPGMITEVSAGFNNRYLKITIYDNASSMYKDFVVPLMNP